MTSFLSSFLLHFAYTDIKETQKENAECPPVFESLINVVHSRVSRLQSSLDSALSVIDAEAEATAAASRAKKDDEGAAQDVLGDEREQLRKKEESWKLRKEILMRDRNPEIEKEKEKASLVWIKWMQFVRRTEVSFKFLKSKEAQRLQESIQSCSYRFFMFTPLSFHLHSFTGISSHQNSLR